MELLLENKWTNKSKNRICRAVFFGRVLGYGTLKFVGSGTSKLYMKNISNPAIMKIEFENIIDETHSN